MGDIMERVKPKDAAKELNMDVTVLYYMMQHDRLPIGYAVKKPGKTMWCYYIYRGLLDTYKRQLEGKG